MRATERIHEEVAPRVYDALAAAGETDERGRIIGQWVGTGKRVLDAGCSYGLVLRYLKSLGNDVVGLDFAPTAIEQCRQRGLTAYKVDIENDSFPEGLGTFDVVLCMETLEHLFDPLVVLQEKLRPILRPGGMLVVTVPNGAYVKDRLHLLMGKTPTFGSGVHLLPYRPYNLDHKTIFTISGLVETLNLAGFVVERLFPTPGYAPGIVIRTRTTRLWKFLARKMPGLFARGLMCVARVRPALDGLPPE